MASLRSDKSDPDNEPKRKPQKPAAWFELYSKALVAVIVTLAAIGIYSASQIPIAVFPTTNFPRVLIAIDNGVMPIDQMMVTITQPLRGGEDRVQGLETVRSITSRGTAEIDLFFNWHVDMFQTLERVNAAMSQIQAVAALRLPEFKAYRLGNKLSFPILAFELDLRHNAPATVVGTGYVSISSPA